MTIDDTPAKVQELLIEGYRRMSPQQKLERVSELTKAVQQLALARIHKLYWYRRGGASSERQWNDVLGVLRVQHDKLDRAYLERGARRRGVTELLERALREARKE